MDKQDLERYGTVPAWGKELGLNEELVRKKVHQNIGVVGRNVSGMTVKLFSERHVMEVCAEYLEDLPTADENGMFVVATSGGSTVYGNPNFWAQKFGISLSEMNRRTRGLPGIDGKSCIKRIYRKAFFTEAQIAPIIADLLREDPALNEEGFLMVGDKKYNTLKGWSLAFGISRPTLRTKLENSDGIMARNKSGARVKVYAEETAREVCAHLLVAMPQAEKDNAIRIEGAVWRTLSGWSDAYPLTKKIVEQAKAIEGMKGKDILGRICVFYEQKEIIGLLPSGTDEAVLDEGHGFSVKEEGGEVRVYRNVNQWASRYSLAQKAFYKNLKDAAFRLGKDAKGSVRRYYDERTVQDAMQIDISHLPQADESGFAVVDDEVFGTVMAWSQQRQVPAEYLAAQLRKCTRIRARNADGSVLRQPLYARADIVRIESLFHAEHENTVPGGADAQHYKTISNWSETLNVSDKTLKRLLADKPFFHGVDASGRRARVYAERVVREACAAHLQDMPQASEEGYFTKDGIRYANVNTWSEAHGISKKTVERLVPKEKRVTGKDSGGRLLELGYIAETDLRQYCAELFLDLPQVGENNYVEMQGTKWSTALGWSLVLGINHSSLRNRLDGLATIRGYSKHRLVCDLYKEEDVIRACNDILTLPKVDRDNTFTVESERFATRGKWAQLLGLDPVIVKERMLGVTGMSAFGKNQVKENAYFGESVVRERCKDLFSPNADGK